MAHEGLAILLALLGVFLIMAYQLGPSKEVRHVKRLEAKAMLVPSGIILLIISVIVLSGIIG